MSMLIKWKTLPNSVPQPVKKDFTIKVKPSTRFSRQHMSALWYATMGFPVISIWPNSKKPLTTNGHNDATTDPAVIGRWWSRTPNANVAISTNNLLVIDVDVKNGKDGRKVLRDLEAKNGPLPTTWRQFTPSGGMHYIFRTKGVIVPSLIDCPGPGIDIRAHDGYILVAPSTVDSKPYLTPIRDEIADAPEWLVQLVLKSSADNLGYHSGTGYHDSSESLTKVNLHSAGEIVCISGMGHTVKVKYDPVAMKLITL